MPATGHGSGADKPSVKVLFHGSRTASEHPDLKVRLLNTRALSSTLAAAAEAAPVSAN